MANGLREKILLEALKEVPFGGFSEETLRAAGKGAGATLADVRRHFPRGGESLVEAFSRWADARMTERMAGTYTARLRDRVAAAVRARIEVMAAHKEAARRAAAFLALPQNAPLAVRCLFATVDAIWRAAGDKTSNFNYYTKRALLAGVYGSTLFYWLSDSSEDNADSWAFLDARIEDVMRIQKARGELERAAAALPDPFGILAALRKMRAH